MGDKTRITHYKILFVAAMITIGSFWAPGVQQSTFRNFPDDALFYPIVARNIVDGQGSTSDGISRTNGYHPLWMGINIVSAFVFENPLAAVAVIQSIGFVLFLFLFYHYIRNYMSGNLAIIFVVIASFEQSFFAVVFGGMETQLAAIFLLLTLIVIRDRDLTKGSTGSLVLVSVLMTLLFLSRLDGGLFWVSLFIVCLCSYELLPFKSKSPRPLLALYVLPVALFIAYASFNHFYYGVLIPISGIINSIRVSQIQEVGLLQYLHGCFVRCDDVLSIDLFSRIVRYARVGAQLANLIKAFYLLAAAAVFTLAISRFRRQARKDVSFPALMLYVVLHVIYYTFLQRSVVSLHWAKGPELIGITVALGYVLTNCVPRPNWVSLKVATRLVIALAMLLSIAWATARSTRTGKICDYSVSSHDLLDAIEYIRQNLPPRTVLASHAVGFLGYYSRYPVLSLDGLLNSPTYWFEYLEKGRVGDYLKERGIRHIVFTAPVEGDPVAEVCRKLRGLDPSEVRVVAEFTKGAGKLRKVVVFEIVGLP